MILNEQQRQVGKDNFDAALGITRRDVLKGLATLPAATAFYLASPPWPHLPAAAVGGHYLYVDRNLIELIAVLLIATAGTGRWLGLDALVWKWWHRRRSGTEAPRSAPEGASTLPPPELAMPRAERRTEPKGVES